ncbi:DUF3300 domain-containing protein [Pseudomonadota bacterium]
MRKSLFGSARFSTLMSLALPCLTVTALATTEDTLTTSDLLAQVNDPAATTSTAAPEPEADSSFDTEHLEQLVAPIALYPDALLMQILMASTYPLEIVEANRWISKQPELKGDALDEALKEEDWDPSVKSLTTLPSVLKQMSENLDWTQDLGDAFLAQQNDLMDTVQRMRGLAYEEGNLETTEQQTVTQQEDKIIVIEPAEPEVIYVPTYSSTVVYGPAWGYPYWYYPGWYYPPRVGYGMVAFGVGVFVGAAIWGGCRWGWGRNQVNINVNRHNTFNRNTNIGGGNQINAQGNRGGGGTAAWQHDSSHRKGVNYSNSNVAQKYGGSAGSTRVTQNQARGRSTASTSNRGTASQAGNRSAASPKAGNSAANRGTTKQAGNRSAASSKASNSAANRNASSNYSALSGSRSPSADRASSYRGASSRGSYSYGGSRGGMSRGGGRRR